VRFIYEDPEALFAKQFDDGFESLRDFIPALMIPTPIQGQVEQLAFVEKNGIRVDNHILESVAYESAIAQVAIWWARKPTTIGREQTSAAIALAMDHLPRMKVYDDKFKFSREEMKARQVVHEQTKKPSSAKAPSVVEMLLKTRFAMPMVRPSDAARNCKTRSNNGPQKRLLSAVVAE
jgi:hypothetical protein